MGSSLWSLDKMRIFLVLSILILVDLGETGDSGTGQVSHNKEAIKELTIKVEHLQTSVIQIKEVLATFGTTKEELRAERKAAMEKLKAEFESKIKQCEASGKHSFLNHQPSSSDVFTNLEYPMKTFPAGMEEDLEAIEKKVTSVVTSTCGTMISGLTRSLDDVTNLLQKTSSDLQVEKKKFSSVIDKVFSMESAVNETLVNVVEQWNKFRVANSDLSLCKEGWHYFNGSCYFFSFTETTWHGGRQECLRLDSDYVKITSTEEWNFVASQITSNSWVGLADHVTDGKFVWIQDGTEQEIIRSWWHEGQPDNHSKGEHCVHFWFHAEKNLWNDAPCGNIFRYICEYSLNDPHA